jgi:N-formylglutamate deformylase
MTITLRRGTTPLLVSMPHVGTHIPVELRGHYGPRALATEDTDWHLERLYSFLTELGASVLVPTVARYVIDLNRPPNDAPMYPGASNTELCPTRFFTGDALYRDGFAPDAKERQRRRNLYWQPYHDALTSELDRLKARHGYALLWDAHSIRGEIPWLFEGRLPDLNIGTADGASAHPSITDAVAKACSASTFSSVVNGRFKGGYITRHYGQPQNNIHAIQLEKCQRLYMTEEAPFEFDDNQSAELRPVLNTMMHAALNAAKALYV